MQELNEEQMVLHQAFNRVVSAARMAALPGPQHDQLKADLHNIKAIVDEKIKSMKLDQIPPGENPGPRPVHSN